MFEKIILKGGILVIVDWSQKSQCKKCHMDIVWANSVTTGRYMPICKDKDGGWISHHANCPFAAQFKRNRLPGAEDKLAEVERQNKRDGWLNK